MTDHEISISSPDFEAYDLSTYKRGLADGIATREVLVQGINDADAEIERLRSLLAEAMKVVEPFANVAKSEDATDELTDKPLKADDDYCSVFSHDVKMRHFRAARAFAELLRKENAE